MVFALHRSRQSCSGVKRLLQIDRFPPEAYVGYETCPPLGLFELSENKKVKQAALQVESAERVTPKWEEGGVNLQVFVQEHIRTLRRGDMICAPGQGTVLTAEYGLPLRSRELVHG